MSRNRIIVVIGSVLLVLGLAVANTHLVSVALRSQSECVLDPQQEGAGTRAAKPSC